MRRARGGNIHQTGSWHDVEKSMVAVTLYSEAFELTGSSKYVAAKELGPVGEKKKKSNDHVAQEGSDQ